VIRAGGGKTKNLRAKKLEKRGSGKRILKSPIVQGCDRGAARQTKGKNGKKGSIEDHRGGSPDKRKLRCDRPMVQCKRKGIGVTVWGGGEHQLTRNKQPKEDPRWFILYISRGKKNAGIGGKKASGADSPKGQAMLTVLRGEEEAGVSCGKLDQKRTGKKRPRVFWGGGPQKRGGLCGSPKSLQEGEKKSKARPHYRKEKNQK